MTAPVQPQPQPQVEGQPQQSQPQLQVEGQAPVPGDVWPPDEATMLALQMDARFSIIDEPTGEQTPDADRQVPPVGATAPVPAGG